MLSNLFLIILHPHLCIIVSLLIFKKCDYSIFFQHFIIRSVHSIIRTLTKILIYFYSKIYVKNIEFFYQ